MKFQVNKSLSLTDKIFYKYIKIFTNIFALFNPLLIHANSPINFINFILNIYKYDNQVSVATHCNLCFFWKFVDQVTATVPAQELWIRNGMWNVTITNTCCTMRPPRVSTMSLPANFSHRGTIRRGITARGKLIVRYNSHNSKHLKCQPELIVATRKLAKATLTNPSLSLSLLSTHLSGD